MQYHLLLTCQRQYAKALFTALSTRYRERIPQITPLHYGATRLDEGFVVVLWSGELHPLVYETLICDPRVIDVASYPVPFFEHVPLEEEDEEEEQVLTRLYDPLRRQGSGLGEEDGR